MKRTIKGLRNDLDLSQEEMAHKLGIPTVTYRRYENYQNKIPTNIIVAIADMCGIEDIRNIKYE